jgi:hypothetical protein
MECKLIMTITQVPDILLKQVIHGYTPGKRRNLMNMKILLFSLFLWSHHKTNNNGFWIWWLDLLALLLQLLLIIINCNSSHQWLPKTRAIPSWTTRVFRCDRLGCDLRISHFFSFRCPLANTPQLNTQLVHDWITNELDEYPEWINQLHVFLL